jgi:lipoprotein Spr
MNTRLCFLIVLALVLTVSCKSKKGVVSSTETTDKISRKEYKALSEKLNLDVKKADNIKLYEFVADWLGAPHQMGKCTKTAIDCSCFIRLAYQDVYEQKIPRSSKEMYDVCKKINREELQEGDLVFFNIKTSKVSHVGVYLKDGWFAHVSTSKGVMINNLSEKYYAQYFMKGGRI